ncbi:NAD(P)/FAD-dependent oxidoreductase [Bradyrhizobium sp. SSUT77]|uniref:NAD(P)/FAD-dependent oxidoreductase n=1 Tax=Bradyrhizobium sp. SSUT77 TaxID=3040603 RepID=UPI0024469C75|nr:NAD(P)/FAD-dependent oxidoreductase [Bradyrhizobium sp. SSUT77]MDH2344168.1 NAD(P)/FAD-dependent oxidoreductase [Bradyrhizobium sp. SSUT77]
MSQSDVDAAARETLRLIGADPQNWVPDRDGVDHNVAIIGGGQSGSAFAFALRRAGIGRVTVIDAADDAASSGPWLTSARMHKLRTPKGLPGPELGLPGLSFQAWYEAHRGAAAYDVLDRIPRVEWAAYLDWYRKTLGIEVRYRTRLIRIEPQDGHLRLHLDVGGAVRTEIARKIILASGFPSNGGPAVPDVVSRDLPKALYAHTSETIDFEGLRDKSVAVLGSAASAFDAAAVALETGAREVHLFARRDALASEPVIRTRGYPGAYDNYGSLPDAVRWHQAIRFRRAGSTPPPDAVARAVKFSNFHLHLATPWTSAKSFGQRLLATTPQGTSPSISQSWARVIRSISPAVRSSPPSPTRSCYGATASRRRPTNRTISWVRILILASATHFWRSSPATRRIFATSTSSTPRRSSASACRSETCRASSEIFQASSRGSAGISSLTIFRRMRRGSTGTSLMISSRRCMRRPSGVRRIPSRQSR